MFYTIKNKKIFELDEIEVNTNNLVIGYLPLDTFKKYSLSLEVSPVIIENFESGKAKYRNSIDVYEDYSYAIMNIIDVANMESEIDRIGLVIKKNLVLFVYLKDEDKHFAKVFQQVIDHQKDNASIDRLLEGILSSLLVNGYEALEKIEHKVALLDNKLVDGRVSQQHNHQIHGLKTKTSTLKHYYKQVAEIGSTLVENENDTINDLELRHLKVFTNRAYRLYESSINVMEDIVHLKEAYSSMLDYELNKVMKLFTVITTIFLPLTLIVGWYGMNFTNMPELYWEYGYVSVIALSIIVIVACIYYFKKKRLF